MTTPTLPPEIEAAIENDRRGLADSLASLRTAITSALAAAREAGRREALEGAAGVESSLLKLAAVAYSQGTHAVRARIGEHGADLDHLRASGDLIVAEQSHRAAIAADKARAVEAASDAAFDRGRAATIKYADGLVMRPVLSREDADALIDALGRGVRDLWRSAHNTPERSKALDDHDTARAALLAALTDAGGGK